MDYDAVMLYVKENKDCSSVDVANEFGVTVAKAFTFINAMIELGLVFRTTVRSPRNNKRIYGYRTIPSFDEVYDNGDGSMREEDIVRNLKRLVERDMEWEATMHLASHNDWRKRNGIEEVQPWKVFGAR